MAWVRVESSVARNRKFVKAGPAPSWLWLCGLAYCKEGLTDGFIPAEAITYLGVKSARYLVEHLVSAGLWDVVEGGWRVHDYLEHNKSAAYVDAFRQERREAGARGGVASGKSRLKHTTEANESDVLQRRSKQLEANTKLLSKPETETETETEERGGKAPAAPPRPMAPIHDTSHKKHAHCGRVCLHASLFGEFVRRRNHADADREIRDWCMSVEREWGDGGPRASQEPGDAFEFWKARYAETWPSVQATGRGPAWLQRVRANQ